MHPGPQPVTVTPAASVWIGPILRQAVNSSHQSTELALLILFTTRPTTAARTAVFGYLTRFWRRQMFRLPRLRPQLQYRSCMSGQNGSTVLRSPNSPTEQCLKTGRAVSTGSESFEEDETGMIRLAPIPRRNARITSACLWGPIRQRRRPRQAQ